MDVHDDNYAELEERLRSHPDARGFVVIALHGVWFWVSTENRDTLPRSIRRALRPGSVVYLSCNALPGWAGFMPRSELMVEHAAQHGARAVAPLPPSAPAARCSRQPLMCSTSKAGWPNGCRALPSTTPSYLTHEYFNADCAPESVIELLRHTSEAKLDFACSATLLEHASVLNIPAARRAALAELPTQRLQHAAQPGHAAALPPRPAAARKRPRWAPPGRPSGIGTPTSPCRPRPRQCR